MYVSRKRLKVTSVEDGEATLTPLECLPLFEFTFLKVCFNTSIKLISDSRYNSKIEMKVVDFLLAFYIMRLIFTFPLSATAVE